MDDTTFCQKHLGQLSRTFALPISMLGPELQLVVMCGYLLCRIADSIEDLPELSQKNREQLFDAFLRVIEHGDGPQTFQHLFASAVSSKGAEQDLALGLDRVLRVLQRSAKADQDICFTWVSELTRGMAQFSKRQPDTHGTVCLESIEDLERYCYFVAGTVGHLLTKLFVRRLSHFSHKGLDKLQEHASAFGIGLQLVNIIKDMREDLSRGWSYVPNCLWTAHGLGPKDMLKPSSWPKIHAAIAPLFDLAKTKLDHALEYSLAIPKSAKDMRLFCLVPLWLAVRTLAKAQHNMQLFEADKKVKISRKDVQELVEFCKAHVADNAALISCYERLKTERLAS